MLKSKSQEQLKELIRLSLKLGINHFETARMYGTSEMQFADALFEMISNGEIKRDDFILQVNNFEIIRVETMILLFAKLSVIDDLHLSIID